LEERLRHTSLLAVAPPALLLSELAGPQREYLVQPVTAMHLTDVFWARVEISLKVSIPFRDLNALGPA
jgi:hypothetical protein